MAQILTKFIGDNQVNDLKERLRNNQPLRARNAADSGDVNVLKADASNVVQLLSQTQLSTVASADTDIINKLFSDLNPFKRSVRVADTVQRALSGGATLTIDGSSLANGDRVLLVGQTSGAENGIYSVSGIGTAYSLTRATDANTGSKILQAFVAVQEGTGNGDTIWMCTTNAPITIDSTALVFSQIPSTAPTVAKKEDLTLNGTDITNQYKDLAFLSEVDSVFLSVNGVVQYQGSDYTLSTVGGVTRVSFAGDLATGGGAALVSGDVLHFMYRH